MSRSHAPALHRARDVERVAGSGEAEVTSPISGAGDALLSLGRHAASIRYPHEPLRNRVWALRHELTPYDASYLALAEAIDGRRAVDAPMPDSPTRARRSLGRDRGQAGGVTRALVTGVTGQDGYLLAEQLLAEGAEVFGLARRADADVPAGVARARRRPAGRGLAARGGRRGAARRALPPGRADLRAGVVRGSAAHAARDRRCDRGAARRRAGARVFVASSSGDLRGGRRSRRRTRRAPKRPRNPYGEAKLAAFEAVAAAR